jgi:RHS repeat-associated protein
MRSNEPQPPNAYQQTGSLPAPSYYDPAPTNTANYDGYLTQMVVAGGDAGVAGSQPKRSIDPTAGLATVGGWSYNLDSGNYNFTVPALSESGRAGMGIKLLMSHNSHALWSVHPGLIAIAFNHDRGFPAPGWRIGFGVIQAKTNTGGPYLNSTTGKQSFIYIASDGTRYDLAYNSSSGFYESYDSSYIRFNLSSRVLQMPNGTRINFQVDAMNNSVNQFLPNYLVDRNGNFINIYYQTLSNGAVVIQYIIDTAGRRIDFNYQNNRLVSISQDRNGTNFYFLRIDYQPVTIQTNFTMATDPANINGTQVYFPVRLTYPTGVNYRFGYTSYGQINSIQKWVPTITGQGAERMIASMSLNMPTYNPSQPQVNCPTFSSRTDWAENWQGGQAQSYQYTYFGADGHTITDPLSRVFKVNNNSATLSVKLVGPGGGGYVKQDEATYITDSGVPYQSNPRVSETKTIDSTNNGKRTTFSYVQRGGMWLPEWKDEFQYGTGALLRRTGFTYTSYPAQYVLGLLQQISVHNGSYTLIHRVRNNYDETGTFTDSNNQTASYFIDATSEGVIQHDDANYGASFTARGNITSVTQDKVEGGAVTGSRIIKRTSYDTNGNVRAVTDGAGNRQQFQFGDYCVNKPVGVGQTHLIPYTQADPTGFRKGAQWDYFTGLTVKTFNLTPGSSTETQIVTVSHDFADRPLQTTRPDGGLVKTKYWDNRLGKATSQLFETGKMQYKFEEYDGAGRARRKASDHPDGVESKFSGQIFVFDQLGNVEDSSNVVAINGNWVPSYEDASTGFLFTHLTRDDLRRLKIITFPDDNTRQFDYTGCSCAGASETRITDEMGHFTRIKTDALGHLLEAIEPWGETGVYSKAIYVYDAMDRVTRIDHTDTSGTKIQSRYFTYDGYGRLIQENTPEGGLVNYTYMANDLPQTKTDARNITTTYIYNTRNLVTSIGYSDGTPSVAFTYDDFGARQTMTDGEGGTNYAYNSFRQLQSETRTFNSLTGKWLTLNYTYNLADQLKSANYVVSNSQGYLIRPEDGETPRNASTRIAMLTAPDDGTGRLEGRFHKLENSSVNRRGAENAEVSQREEERERGFSSPFLLSSSFLGESSAFFAPLRLTAKIPSHFSFLKPGQKAQWRPSPAEAKSPRVVKTALVRRVAPPSAAQDLYISGRVTTAQGAGISGVNITVTNIYGGSGGTASMDSNGNYTVSQLWPGESYSVTPSKTGYTFNPPSRTYSALQESVDDANFTGAVATYTISGRVTTPLGAGMSQVTVTLSGSAGGSVTTDANGNYSFTNLSLGNYTVTPSKAGYNFTPSNRTYPNLSANVTNADFSGATPPPTTLNKMINYGYNSAGTLGGVGTDLIGSDPNATTNVLNSTTFRAGGAIRGMNYGNGRRLAIGYDANREQPISMKVDRVSNPSDKIIDYAYDYNDPYGNNNNRIRKVTDNIDPGYTTTYLYDEYDRLASANASAYFRSYSFDPWGNITNFSAVQFNYATNASGAPATNRVVSDSSGANFSYDAVGNMTQEWSTTFGYDGASRLKSVNGTSSTYGYDGNGYRVRQTKWDGSLFYVRSSVLKNAVMEVKSSGVQRVHVYSPGGKLIAEQSTDGQFYWLHTNQLGTARAMTDVNGNLAYKGQFDPYGQTLFEWSASYNTELNTRKFTGYERDGTGLDYANARTYNSGRGRFMQADPMGRECQGQQPNPLGAAEKSMPQTMMSGSARLRPSPYSLSIRPPSLHYG